MPLESSRLATAEGPHGGSARKKLARNASAVDLIKSLAAEDLGQHRDAGKPPPVEYRRALAWAILDFAWYLAALASPVVLLVTLTQDLAADSIVGPVRQLLGASDRSLADAITGPASFLGWINTVLVPRLGPRGGGEGCGRSRDVDMPALPPGSQLLLSDDFAAANASVFHRPHAGRWKTCGGKLLGSNGPQRAELRAASAVTLAGSSAIVIEAGVSNLGFLPGYGMSVCSDKMCLNVTLGTTATLLRLEKRVQFCPAQVDAQQDVSCTPQLAHAESSAAGLNSTAEPAHACQQTWQAPGSFALTLSRKRVAFRDDRYAAKRPALRSAVKEACFIPVTEPCRQAR
jgi:hypothetical protein